MRGRLALTAILLCSVGLVSCSDGGTILDPPEEDLPASVTAVTSQTSYEVGDTVVVDVIIENATNVGSTPFHLSYTSEVVQFLDATEGDFLAGVGSTVFLADDHDGEVVVGLSLLQGVGASGSGTLAVLRFQAVAPGICDLGFTNSFVKDPQAQNLPASYSATYITVTGSR